MNKILVFALSITLALCAGGSAAQQTINGNVIRDGTTPLLKLDGAGVTAGKYPKSNGSAYVTSTLSAAGIGSCTTAQFVQALLSDAAPTCTTFSLLGAQFANAGTTTTVLHGNAAGNLSFGSVSLSADVTGSLPQASVTDLVTDLAGKQPVDATLTALSGANWALNSTPRATGADTVTQQAITANQFMARASTGDFIPKSITDFGLSLADDADNTAGRSTLGLGTAATQNTGTSGAAIPFLNGTNTWANPQTFSSTIVGSINGNANTVTTNANLTGPVTSTGNATSITNNAVTNAAAAQMPANTVKANVTGGLANQADVTLAGFKTWLALVSADISDFFAQVRATLLTGLSTATNAVITAADSILTALGKLQAQLFSVHLNAVSDCGLDPTGAANNTDAEWQSCFDLFPAAGGRLYFPTGAYRLELNTLTTINIDTPVLAYGAGRTIANIVIVHPTKDGFTNVTGSQGAGFEQVRFSSVNATTRTGGYALNMGDVPNTYFQQADCLFQHSCIRSAGPLQFVDDANLREGGANAPNGAFIVIDGAGDRYVRRITTDNPSDPTGFAGVRVRRCASLVISDSNIINSGNALDIVPNGGPGTAVASVLVVNTFFDSSVIGVNILPATASDTAHRIRIVNSWFGSNTTANVRMGNGVIPNANIASVEFVGNDFFSNGTSPFGLDVQGATDWSVRASRFGGHLTNAIRVAVGVGTADHRFSITDNLIGSSLGVGNNAQGVTIGAGTYDQYQVLDNRALDKNTTPGIADSGTVGATGWKNVANNIGGSPLPCTSGADVTTSGTAAFVLLTCRIPANSVVVGSTFSVEVVGVTAASGNPTWSVAVGATNPATTVAWTTAAMTSAAAAGGGYRVLCTVKTIGTVTCAGLANVLALVASSATATAQAVTMTGDWYITARVAMSASTFRATSAVIRPN